MLDRITMFLPLTSICASAATMHHETCHRDIYILRMKSLVAVCLRASALHLPNTKGRNERPLSKLDYIDLLRPFISISAAAVTMRHDTCHRDIYILRMKSIVAVCLRASASHLPKTGSSPFMYILLVHENHG